MADTTATAPQTGGGGATDQAKDKAGQVAGQAQEKVGEVAGQAKEQVQQVAGQAQSQVRTQVDQRSTQAGEQVNQQAQDLRTVAEKLREEGKDGPAKVADQVADRAQSVGSYLRDADTDRLLNDLEDFGRQRPWAIMLGGLAVGFAASRFLKASSQQRYQSRPQQLPNAYDRPGGFTPPPTGVYGTGGVERGYGRGDGSPDPATSPSPSGTLANQPTPTTSDLPGGV
jgi:gas vesicle protein